MCMGWGLGGGLDLYSLNDSVLNAFLNYTRDNSFLLDQRIVLTVGLLNQYLRFVMKRTTLPHHTTTFSSRLLRFCSHRCK